MNAASKVLPISVFFIIAVSADQFSKTLVSKYFFVWCNEGSVFGFGGNTGGNLVISLASFSILIYFLYFIFRQEKLRENFPLILILSGGMSNLFDRLIFGCVRDFIQIFKWFPVFNLADIFISIGVLLFVFSTIKNFKKHE